MVDRSKSPEQGVPQGPGQETGAPLGLTEEQQRGASAEATQGLGAPRGAEPPSPGDLMAFGADNERGQGAPVRSVNELAKDPAVRAALENALKNGGFTHESLKAVVQQGLETGEFVFKSEGQERVVKAKIAEAITPVPAGPKGEAPDPAGGARTGRDPQATIPVGGKYDLAIKDAVAQGKDLPAPAAPEKGYTMAEAKALLEGGHITIPEVPAMTEALKKVAGKLPEGLDERVAAALSADPDLMDLKNSVPEKKGFQASKPAINDAVRYANQIAVKTGDFEPATIQGNFRQAFEQATRSDLFKLAESQGVNLYPDYNPSTSAEGRKAPGGRTPDSPVPAEGAYDRAIKAAQAQGKEIPAPADPEKGYTMAEANKMAKDKLIFIDENARSRNTPDKPKEIPLAGREDARTVIDYVMAGHGRDGGPGIPVEAFKSLGTKSRNEVSAIVRALKADPQANVPVTSYLVKDFKEKVFNAEPQPA